MSPFFAMFFIFFVSSSTTDLGKNLEGCRCDGLKRGLYCGHELIKHAKEKQNLSLTGCTRDAWYICLGPKGKVFEKGTCSQDADTIVKYCCVLKTTELRGVDCLRNYTASPIREEYSK